MAQGVGNLNVSVTASTGKARAELRGLGAEAKGLRRPFGKAQQGIAGVGGGLGKLGPLSSIASAGIGAVAGAASAALLTLVSLRAVIHGVADAMQRLDKLGKTADKLGVGTKELAGLRLAAEETGVASNTLDMALQRMTRRLAEAAMGTGEAKGALAELGLDAQRLAMLEPDEQFRAIAGAMADVPSQADKVRLAFKLFDSEGVALVNTLGLGAEGLDEIQAAAEKLGIALDRGSIAKVEAANDAIGRMKHAGDGLSNSLAVTFAPAVEGAANFMSRLVSEFNAGLGLIPEVNEETLKTERAQQRAAAAEAKRLEVQQKLNAEFRKQLATLRQQEQVARLGERDAALASDEKKYGFTRAAELADARDRVADAREEADQLAKIRDLRKEIAQYGMTDLAKRRAELVEHGFSTAIRKEADRLFADLERLDREQQQRDKTEKQYAKDAATLKSLQDRVAGLGKDPLQAERDRTLAGISDYNQRAEAAALFDKLAAEQRRQTEARLAFDAQQTRNSRRNDPLDANTAEGFAALRSSVGNSPQLQQLDEARKHNAWLEQIAINTEHNFGIDAAATFSLN